MSAYLQFLLLLLWFSLEYALFLFLDQCKWSYLYLLLYCAYSQNKSAVTETHAPFSINVIAPGKWNGIGSKVFMDSSDNSIYNHSSVWTSIRNCNNSCMLFHTPFSLCRAWVCARAAYKIRVSSKNSRARVIQTLAYTHEQNDTWKRNVATNICALLKVNVWMLLFCWWAYVELFSWCDIFDVLLHSIVCFLFVKYFMK